MPIFCHLGLPTRADQIFAHDFQGFLFVIGSATTAKGEKQVSAGVVGTKQVGLLSCLDPAPIYKIYETGPGFISGGHLKYTQNSLAADGFEDFNVEVAREGGVYKVKVTAEGSRERLQMFADRHVLLFSSSAGGKAVAGKRLMERFGVWNPMSGYPVNQDKNDGKCKWNLFPPLGLNIIGQRGILLMHYPPWQVLQQATFLEVMTMHRWTTVPQAAGVPKDEVSFYRTFVDVNPIAAPGSGQREYPNDYFPIMMASGFFHGPDERDYIRSMLELYVAPPGGGGNVLTRTPRYRPSRCTKRRIWWPRPFCTSTRRSRTSIRRKPDGEPAGAGSEMMTEADRRSRHDRRIARSSAPWHRGTSSSARTPFPTRSTVSRWR